MSTADPESDSSTLFPKAYRRRDHKRAVSVVARADVSGELDVVVFHRVLNAD